MTNNVADKYIYIYKELIEKEAKKRREDENFLKTNGFKSLSHFNSQYGRNKSYTRSE